MNNKRNPKSLTEIIENSWTIVLFILITGVMYAIVSKDFIYFMGYVFILILSVLGCLWVADYIDTRSYNKKIEQEEEKRKQDLADLIIFKDGQAAFDYACKYSNNQINANQGIIALVVDWDMKLDSSGDLYYLYEIKIASDPNPITINSTTSPRNREQSNLHNELVIWVPHKYIGVDGANVNDAENWEGFISAKVDPILSISKGWNVSPF